MIEALQAQGNVVFSGKVAEEIAPVLIMEMESREELDESVQAMPGVEIFEIEIIPLEDFETQMKAPKAVLEAMKGILNE